MGFWQGVLESIRDGTSERAPPCVRALAFDRDVRLVKWEEGMAQVRWQAAPQYANGAGAIFGGYVSAVADIAADFAMMTVHAADQMHTTADLRVSFFRPILPGPCEVVSRVVHRGRNNAFVEVEFRDKDGKLCAKASLTEAIVKSQPAGQS